MRRLGATGCLVAVCMLMRSVTLDRLVASQLLAVQRKVGGGLYRIGGSSSGAILRSALAHCSRPKGFHRAALSAAAVVRASGRLTSKVIVRFPLLQQNRQNLLCLAGALPQPLGSKHTVQEDEMGSERRTCNHSETDWGSILQKRTHLNSMAQLQRIAMLSAQALA